MGSAKVFLHKRSIQTNSVIDHLDTELQQMLAPVVKVHQYNGKTLMSTFLFDFQKLSKP